eukprot:15478196-Alexandrium_andersonii.AAC.3
MHSRACRCAAPGGALSDSTCERDHAGLQAATGMHMIVYCGSAGLRADVAPMWIRMWVRQPTHARSIDSKRATDFLHHRGGVPESFRRDAFDDEGTAREV